MSSNSATTTDRVDISVPATSKTNEKHAPSDAQESPQTGAVPAEKASENAASIRSRRSSNTRLVATALDFYSDGTCKLHETHARPCQPHELPPFLCPIQPNTLRVIFFDTHDVFDNPSRAVSSSRSDLFRNVDCQNHAQLTTCEVCTKVQGPDLSAQAMSKLQDLHQQGADREPGAVVSTAQDSVSETVPKSAPTLPEKATSDSPTPDVEETAKVNSMDAPCPKPFTGNAAEEQAPIAGRATSPASSLLRIESSEADVSNDHHKTYRGAYGINSLELFALWDRSSHDISLPLGSNIISQAETPTEMDRVLARTAILSQDYSMIHSLNLKGQMSRFYTVPASVKYRWQSQALQGR